ncbi:MAG: hypothetical protein ACI8YQ_003270 [Polaribacter sp.]|jgi:hypothetical protein
MKKAHNPNSFFSNETLFWSVLLLLCFFTSCKDDIEGCKDINASNWNASADSSCEDCCIYPELKLNISHAYGNTTFRYREPYKDVALNVFTVLSIRYYLSDFSLTTDMETYVVTDSLETTTIVDGVVSENTAIHDDASFVTVGTSTTSLGDFPSNNLFLDSLSFYLGLSQPLNSVDPGSVPNSHPLAPKADSMYWDESRGYIFQRLAIIPDTAVADTLILEIGGDDLLRKITLAYGKTTLTGFDQNISIKIDYKCWFTGINFAMDREDVLKEKIVSNMSKSFSISE